MTVRPIKSEDNDAIRDVIIEVLTEYGCIGPGYACNDPETQAMSTAYNGTTGQYWVIEDPEGNVLGGGGFSRLKGTHAGDGVAELQKVYFSPQLRGLGLGKQILILAIEGARSVGYTTLYAETVPHMTLAIGLYERLGFQLLTAPMGATGHAERCTVRYALTL
jgi:putative acetyltransferase